MHKIPYLTTICDQIARLEVFANADNLPNETLARINRALALSSHLLDELARPQYNSEYFERQLADLVKRVDHIADKAPTIIEYRGATAEISPCRRGYKCVVTDTLGNALDWHICAATMPEALEKVSRHFDKAIAYLRGFITMWDFYERVGVN